ncbi:D-2-hydroxyacid dehydrogenase family protein [Agromyces ramosus]|uniref:Phosphoglycerate dehydrogenase-like enzyme n=1 Tax=Agromyces ramosus TaxID=33879 RepID=A0ABU0RAD0_9MICO|nr:D-2-hydroxyacid dehydrogenase family protein [Agromyces ramosus]MDQ0895034.1 phosphoglycerate dehydrogenase-like enzyme [Agromyces ramosus]
MRIAILDDYQGAALDAADWSGLDADITVFREHLGDADAVAAALEPFDVIVAMRERTRFPRAVLSRLGRLRLLVTTGMRNDSIDLVAADELGIVVCGTGIAVAPTAELTWALILGLVRGVASDDAVVRRGGWQTSVPADLEGSTLGIVGLGRLGQRVAAVAHAFGMHVIAWSPHLTDERAAALGVAAVTRAELFERSDIVTIHLGLGESTRGLLGVDDLRRMPRTALLVNTSRAAIIDDAALLQAVAERWIAGLGIDVYDTEPLPADHWMRKPDSPGGTRVLRSPHMGYVTAGNLGIFYRDAVEDIAAFAAGAPVRVLTS